MILIVKSHYFVRCDACGSCLLYGWDSYAEAFMGALQCGWRGDTERLVCDDCSL